MRFDRAFGNEHSFTDFRICESFGREDDRFTFALRQSVEHGACFVTSGLSLLLVQVDTALMRPEE